MYTYVLKSTIVSIDSIILNVLLVCVCVFVKSTIPSSISHQQLF